VLSRFRVATAVVGGLVAAGAALAGPGSAATGPACPTANWSSPWHDVTHSSSVLSACTPISPVTVTALTPKWYSHASNVVSASPTVVGDTVYVGDWNGVFTAYDAATGTPKWHHQIRVTSPDYPGHIVSTASVVPFADPTAPGGKRLAVIFGGGSSLWALDAATGRELASISLDPRNAATKAVEAAAGQDPQIDVESSPAVADVLVNGTVDRRIYVGIDVHDDRDVGRTGIIALHLVGSGTHWAFDPIWKLDAETGAVYQGLAGLTANSGTGLGCGGVWSSPAIDLADGLVVFGTASCSNPEDAQAAGTNWSERMVAARVDTGKIVWAFRPATKVQQAHLDDDFGASPNVFTNAKGQRLIGEGRKSGCYYARYAATGRPAWQNCTATSGHAGNDFAIGGYLGTTAVQTDADGRALRIIGATAVPVPRSWQQVVHATVAVRAIDPTTGATLWTYRLAGPTYGSVSVANGVAFVPDTTSASLIALDAANGLLVKALPVVGPPSSTPVVVGGSVYVSAGTSESGIPLLNRTGGVYRFALPASLPGPPSLP
jgi:outer membrane protein assembly factor BamB